LKRHIELFTFEQFVFPFFLQINSIRSIETLIIYFEEGINAFFIDFSVWNHVDLDLIRLSVDDVKALDF